MIAKRLKGRLGKENDQCIFYVLVSHDNLGEMDLPCDGPIFHGDDKFEGFYEAC